MVLTSQHTHAAWLSCAYGEEVLAQVSVRRRWRSRIQLLPQLLYRHATLSQSSDDGGGGHKSGCTMRLDPRIVVPNKAVTHYTCMCNSELRALECLKCTREGAFSQRISNTHRPSGCIPPAPCFCHPRTLFTPRWWFTTHAFQYTRLVYWGALLSQYLPSVFKARGGVSTCS